MAFPLQIERRPVSQAPQPAGHFAALRTARQEVLDDGADLGPGELAAQEALKVLFGWMVQPHGTGSWTRGLPPGMFLRERLSDRTNEGEMLSSGLAQHVYPCHD